LKAGYKKYQAYSYLEEGKDYKTFKMAPEVGRVPEYLIPLSPEEEKRAEKVAKVKVGNQIIDTLLENVKYQFVSQR
jgi:membrane dipeptidase